MNPEDKEKLEQLLIDRALGHITDEDRARLEEALASDAQLRQLAQQIEKTVGLARSAMASAEEVSADSLPPLLTASGEVPKYMTIFWLFARPAAALAACLVVVVTLWLVLGRGPTAKAELGPIEVIPRAIELTVFSEPQRSNLQTRQYPQRQMFQQRAMPVRDLPPGNLNQPLAIDRGPNPGLSIGLIRDHRLILNLRKGDNVVRFTDVSAGIIPTSVRFVSDTDPEGTEVIEQNFEFDLATSDALLKRYIDHKINCVGQDGSIEEGFLASFDGANIVLSEKPGAGRTRTLTRQNLLAIRLDKLPEGLISRPTLVWKLRARTQGEHETTLSYLTNDIVWRADYIVRLTPTVIPAKAGIHLLSSGHNAASGSTELFTDTDLLDLKGWVTITNQSGGSYADAKLKLIAGDVHTVVEQPDSLVWYEFYYGSGPSERLYEAPRKEFQEKAFFEYHLYTLSAPSTVRDNQIKQLNLLAKKGVKADRVFFYPAWQNNQKVDVQLRFKNDTEHNLGMPLPKGHVRFMQSDSDGEVHQVGEDSIDHTPKDEDVELTIGQAFEVVGERVITDHRQPSDRILIQDVRITLRNHKGQAIKAVLEDKLNARSAANWKITAKSDDYLEEDFQTIHFEFDMPSNSEKVITYTVRYDW